MFSLAQHMKSLKKEQLLSICLIILICVLSGLRFVYCFRNIYIRSDRAHIFELADSIYNGRGFVIDYIIWPSLNWPTVTHPEVQRHPLFPLLVAFSFLLFGEHIIVANCVSTFFSILTAILMYKIGKNYGRNAGLLSSFIYLLNPYAFIISINAFATTVYGFFLTIAFWQFTKLISNSKEISPVLSRQRLLAYMYVGLPAGLAWLARPEGILIIPVFFLFLILFTRKITKFQQLFIVTLIVILVMTPWMIRNYSLFRTPFHGNVETKLWAKNYEDVYMLNAQTKEDYFEHHDLSDFINVKILNFVWGLVAFGMYSLSEYGPSPFNKFPFFVIFAFVGSYYLYKAKEKWFFLLYIYLVIYCLTISMQIVYPTWGLHVYNRYYVALQPLFTILASVGIIKSIESIRNFQLGTNQNNPKTNRKVGLVLLILLIAAFHYQCLLHGYEIYKTGEYLDRRHGWTHWEYVDASLWLKENTPPDAIIMTRYLATIHHYSQRRCVMIPKENLTEILSFAETYNVSYLVLTQNAVVKRRSLTPVWEGEMTNIFELCIKTDTYRIYFIRDST